MAYTASQPVNEVPGFARVGEAIRRGVLKLTTPIFGTPENPTAIGRFADFVDEAAQYGTLAGPAAAVGRMRFSAHPVRGKRLIDERFLGRDSIPLVRRGSSPAAPKSMFSNSPGGLLMVTNEGKVVLPREADVRLYGSERVRLPGGRSVALTEFPSIASDLDAARMPLADKRAAVAGMNDAATPYWMYWMYQKDVADANATLAAHRSSAFYDNAGIRNYDVLPKGAASTVVGSPVGTRFRLATPGLGEVEFVPNHISAMTRDRFVKDPRLFDVYNDGYLPYQSATFVATPRRVGTRTVTPVMRATDHHETVVGGSLAKSEYQEYDRVYHKGREVPYYRIRPIEQEGVDLMYKLDDGTPVVRSDGAYSVSVAVQQASKGGDSPHRNFRNFLATDKVPDSIFGYPVVQRAEDYTPEDIEFFKANPKAAGFYDDGDDAAEPDDVRETAERPAATREAAKGGNARKDGLIDAPTLADEGRPMYFYRDKQGKITGYGTTRSMVHEDNGKFFVIPTIIDNGDGTSRLVGSDDAIGWYAETGEHWGSHGTREAAEAASKARSAKHAQMYQEDWNEYVQDHWDDMSPEIQRDPGALRLHTLRTGAYPGNLNNPGNVKAFGEPPAGVDPKNPKRTSPVNPNLTFWRFLTPEAGLNAAADTVVDIIESPKKMNRAPFTIENLVRHYAPSTENDTEAYIKDMVSFTGMARDAVMDRNDPKQMATLLKALVRRDSGAPFSDWFPRTTYRKAAERLKEKEGD